MAKGCALITGYLPREGLPRNSVDRITDRPDMTLAVDGGCKASTQTNKNKIHLPYGASAHTGLSLITCTRKPVSNSSGIPTRFDIK